MNQNHENYWVVKGIRILEVVFEETEYVNQKLYCFSIKSVVLQVVYLFTQPSVNNGLLFTGKK